MRRRVRRGVKAEDFDDVIRSWAVVVEADSDGQAQVIAAGAELNLEITSGPLVRVLGAVVEAAQRARGSALLCVVEPGGTSSLVATRDGQVVPAARALAERDVAAIFADRPPRRARPTLPGEDALAEVRDGDGSRRLRHRWAADLIMGWCGRWVRT